MPTLVKRKPKVCCNRELGSRVPHFHQGERAGAAEGNIWHNGAGLEKQTVSDGIAVWLRRDHCPRKRGVHSLPWGIGYPACGKNLFSQQVIRQHTEEFYVIWFIYVQISPMTSVQRLGFGRACHKEGYSWGKPPCSPGGEKGPGAFICQRERSRP